MSDLTDLIVHALPLVQTVCTLTAATAQILLARSHPTTDPHTTQAPEEKAAAPAPAPAMRPSHIRYSRVLRATLHTARGAAAVATVLTWLHQTGVL